MPSTESVRKQNTIIGSLPDEERFLVVRSMEPVDMPNRATVLCNLPSFGRCVYFPTSGLVSIVAEMASGERVECAAMGAEGWFGEDLFGGIIPPSSSAFQQVAGTALRMSHQSFHDALRYAPRFAERIHRFVTVLLTQAMQSAACNRVHDVLSRCSRWLLFTAERTGREELPVTHEFLGQMLGTSRPVVTETLARLEQRELISGARGQIVIRDAEALAQVACECHQVVKDAYDRYLDSLGVLRTASIAHR